MTVPNSSAKPRLLATAAIAASVFALSAPVFGSHSWNGYHWKRTTAEISPPVGDNVDSKWDAYLDEAIADWNASTVINSAKVAGTAGNPKRCSAKSGTIQVCNALYGNNGWLGIAQIWLSGGHIYQGITKVNDTYFNTSTYNKPEWRRLVMCQEIGHDYGLDHQDENFTNTNLGTCQDYTNNPLGPPTNEHPNTHDYDQLVSIYNHVESAMTAQQAPSSDIGGDTPAEWGRAVSFDGLGRPNVFERAEGAGRKVVTHVFWAVGEGPRGNR